MVTITYMNSQHKYANVIFIARSEPRLIVLLAIQQVLNDCMDVTKAAGAIGIPGLYVTSDPGAVDAAAKEGSISMRLGQGWSRSHTFVTGQCPVMRYHRDLMNAILFDKIKIADAVNVKMISLDDAPAGYADFDKGAAKKFVIDPHNSAGLL